MLSRLKCLIFGHAWSGWCDYENPNLRWKRFRFCHRVGCHVVRRSEFLSSERTWIYE